MTYPFWAWHDTTPWYHHTTLPSIVHLSILQYHYLSFPSFHGSDQVGSEMVRPEMSSRRWYMDHDERVVWLLDDVVEANGSSWSIQIWAITHDFRESRWSEGDFMRWWWVACDDRVSWFSEDIDGYHRASVGAFTRFRRSWHDYVRWMPVFSIGHVRSWKHDVRGCGQRMGGHHFMSLFTLPPSHIELSIASPLSLARAS